MIVWRIPESRRKDTMTDRLRPRCGGWSAACCAATLILGGGCGDSSTSSSSTEATVHGTVTIKGKPASSGMVEFNPANINRKDVRAVSAPIGKDGSYSLK